MSTVRFNRIKQSLSAQKVVIREAALDDLFAMTSLLGELFTIEADFTPDVRHQREGLAALMASEDATLLVASMADVIVGMCTLQPLISTAEGGVAGMVEDLIVADGYRGMGIGRQLLTEIEKRASEQGMSRLQLLTDQGHDQADRFYDRHGWKATSLVARRKMLV